KTKRPMACDVLAKGDLNPKQKGASLMLRSSVVSALIALAPLSALAQAPSDAKDTGLKVMGLDVTGYVDASYNHLSRSNLFTSGVPSRVFDLNQNGLTLQQAAVKISKTPTEGFGGMVNLT